MAGIKETKEALVGVNEVGLLIAKKFKDGVQFEDFVSFYNAFRDDAEFRSKLEVAWDAHQAIPDEVKDIDLGEAVDLGLLQLGYVPKFVEALK